MSSITSLNSRKKGSWGKKLLTLFVSTLISLAIVEIVLRTVFPYYQTSSVQAYQYDDELGYRLRPGIHLFEVTDFQQEVRVNDLGTVNFQEKFDGYENIILAVGDSFTQGTGLPSDMSYPAQLDMIVNQDEQGFYRQKYGVVNLGLAAFGAEQSLLALRRWTPLVKKPKYILYLGSGNDYEDDLLFRSGYRHKHIVEGNPSWGSWVRPLQLLTNDLQIGIRLKLLIGQLRRSNLFSANNYSSSPAEQTVSVAELERQSFDNLAAFARENDAKLIVGWAGPGTSYEWLKNWAGENSVTFADWLPKMKSVTDNIPNLPTENQHSGGHYRGWVNRLIAEEYGRQIQADTR